jgi:hypothetical protein
MRAAEAPLQADLDVKGFKAQVLERIGEFGGTGARAAGATYPDNGCSAGEQAHRRGRGKGCAGRVSRSVESAGASGADGISREVS